MHVQLCAAAPRKPTPAPQRAPRPRTRTAKKKTKGTILVVDDEHSIRVVLRQVLEEEGYRVASATNGGEALRYLAGHRPCVILLDLQMPIMSGWDLAAELAKNPMWSKIPVVVISAYLNSVRVPETIAPVVCFEKPLDMDKLLATIARFCG